MSNRRRPKRRPYLPFVTAAAVLAVGGGAMAVVGLSGSSKADGTSVTSADAAATAGAVPGGGGTAGAAVSGTGSATTKASTSAKSSASGSAKPGSASPSASASGSAAKAGSSGGSRGTTSTVASGSGAVPSARVFTGQAFDTCTAPSLSTMRAWRPTSPYGAAAVYVGGANRGCAQPNLTASWVSQVAAGGWQLIPLYVGAQPPCQTSSNPERISAANASSLGASDGADAARKAAGLGMRQGSAIYLDMEPYDTTNTACAAAVQTYVQAWDRAAHGAGYLAAFYGFSKSSADAVARAAANGVAGMPDALWYARYDGNADTTTGFPWSASLWSGHRRGHQYAVNLRESYGGATLTVDHDAWDAPVAVIG